MRGLGKHRSRGYADRNSTRRCKICRRECRFRLNLPNGAERVMGKLSSRGEQELGPNRRQVEVAGESGHRKAGRRIVDETTPSAQRGSLVPVDAHRDNVAVRRPVRVPDVRAAVSGVLGRAFAGRAASHALAARLLTRSRIGHVIFQPALCCNRQRKKSGGSNTGFLGPARSGFAHLTFLVCCCRGILEDIFIYGLSGDRDCGSRLALPARITGCVLTRTDIGSQLERGRTASAEALAGPRSYWRRCCII